MNVKAGQERKDVQSAYSVDVDEWGDWEDEYEELEPIDMSCAVHPDRFAPGYCDACGRAMCDSCTRRGMRCVTCAPRERAQVASHSPKKEKKGAERCEKRRRMADSLELDSDAWRPVHSGLSILNRCDDIHFLYCFMAVFAIFPPMLVLLLVLVLGERVARLVAAVRLRRVPLSELNVHTRRMFGVLLIGTLGPALGVLMLFLLEPTTLVLTFGVLLLALVLLARLSRWAYMRFVKELASGLGAITVLAPLQSARHMRNVSLWIVGAMLVFGGLIVFQGLGESLAGSMLIQASMGLGGLALAICGIYGKSQMRLACRNLEYELNEAVALSKSSRP